MACTANWSTKYTVTTTLRIALSLYVSMLFVHFSSPLIPPSKSKELTLLRTSLGLPTSWDKKGPADTNRFEGPVKNLYGGEAVSDLLLFHNWNSTDILHHSVEHRLPSGIWNCSPEGHQFSPPLMKFPALCVSAEKDVSFLDRRTSRFNLGKWSSTRTLIWSYVKQRFLAEDSSTLRLCRGEKSRTPTSMCMLHVSS